MRQYTIKFFLIGSMVLLIQACSILSPVNTKVKNTYLLSPDNIEVTTAEKTSYSVLITEPKAAAGYSNTNLSYVTKPYLLKSFTDNSWVDQPAKMLAPLMVIALQKTQHYHAVIAAPYVGKTDFRVDSELIRLHQNFLTHPSQIEMHILVRIVNPTTQTVTASRLFQITVPAKDNPYGGIVAANQATEQFLKEFAEFCLHET